MKSVRAMLIALVVACVAPALASALLRAREAESTLLEGARRRVERVQGALTLELSDYQKNGRMALVLAEQAATFPAAVAGHDAAGAQGLVTLLAKVYPHRSVVVADVGGRPLAVGNPDRAPRSLGPETSPAFAELLAGSPIQGLIPISLGGVSGFAIVAGEPVVVDGQVAGAFALVTPVDAGYLDNLSRKVDAQLALRVGGKVVATTSGFSDPGVAPADGPSTLISTQGGRLVASRTFALGALQRPGPRVELTASQDVTELRRRSRSALYRSLGLLGAALLVGLALAFVIARRVDASLRAISRAAAEVKEGRYALVPESRHRDELGLLASDFNAMVRGLIERDRIKDTFGRYFTRQVAEHVLSSKLELGGDLLPVTVLFSDIRSFTTLSEHMPPRELLDFLNVFFTGMVDSVMAHEGVVDKFIGDAIMAIFGAPVPHPADPLNAVKAALAMRQRLAEMNEGFERSGKPQIRAGIGLHAGEVVAGNMGHAERMEYTVIGDAVNVASRLEGMTKELQADILISEDLYRKVESEVNAEPLEPIHVKGRAQRIMVYRLIALRPPARALPPQ